MPDPLGIGTCVLWLKADDASTVHATGGLVDQWDDKSGNTTGGNHHVTATGASRPSTGVRNIHGKNAIKFSGTTVMQTIASFSVALNFTIIAAANNDSGADSTTQQLIRDVTNGRAAGKFSNNQWYEYLGGNAAFYGAVNDHLHRFVFLMKSGALSIINDDGVESGPLNPGTAGFQGGIRIGSTWNGTIGEILVYSTELNATNRQAGIDYLEPWVSGGTARDLAAKIPSATSEKASLSTVHASKQLVGKAAMSTSAKQGNVLQYR